ncbi:MAG: glutaredoxin [Bacteroidales bacterium]
MKRQVEIFTAGCPVCDPVIQLVKDTSCGNCEITVYNLREQRNKKNVTDKIKHYGINQDPSVVVDGKLLECCDRSITKEDLITAGIGQA